jgi:hypothetical protein
MHNSYSSCTKAKTNVFPCIFLSLVLDWKGNGVFGKGKASTTTLSVSFILCPTHKLSLISFLQKGRKGKASQVSSFLAITAKGGEINRPKAKGPHHHPFSNFQKLFDKGEEIITNAKTLLTPKGRTSSGGAFI